MKKSKRNKLQATPATNYRVNVFGIKHQSTDSVSDSIKNNEIMNNVTLNSIMGKLSDIENTLDKIEKELSYLQLKSCGQSDTNGKAHVFIPQIIRIEDIIRNMIDEQLELKTLIKSNKYVKSSQNHNSGNTRSL